MQTGTVSVRRAIYESGTEIDSEEYTQTVEVPFFGDVPLAEVEVEGGVTRNMGNYESARVSVNIRLPALPEMSELERVYGIASRFVSEKIQQELDIATGDSGEHAPAPAPAPAPSPQPEQSQDDFQRQQAAGIRRNIEI